MNADVPKGGGPENRVGDRVAHDVGIRVSLGAALRRDGDAAENQRTPRHQSMQVAAETRAAGARGPHGSTRGGVEVLRGRDLDVVRVAGNEVPGSRRARPAASSVASTPDCPSATAAASTSRRKTLGASARERSSRGRASPVRRDPIRLKPDSTGAPPTGAHASPCRSRRSRRSRRRGQRRPRSCGRSSPRKQTAARRRESRTDRSPRPRRQTRSTPSPAGVRRRRPRAAAWPHPEGRGGFRATSGGRATTTSSIDGCARNASTLRSSSVRPSSASNCLGRASPSRWPRPPAAMIAVTCIGENSAVYPPLPQRSHGRGPPAPSHPAGWEPRSPVCESDRGRSAGRWRLGP